LSVPAISGTSTILGVLSTALDGLQARQDVIADNIANVDTPGYRSSSIDFEDSLRDAIRTNGDVSLHARSYADNTPVGADGNNVDLRQQMMAAQQTQFQYQLMTRAVSDQYALIKTAAASF
jgi:flagellar basal-body rod protein FlgB